LKGGVNNEKDNDYKGTTRSVEDYGGNIRKAKDNSRRKRRARVLLSRKDGNCEYY
jgi:hypothetical protein